MEDSVKFDELVGLAARLNYLTQNPQFGKKEWHESMRTTLQGIEQWCDTKITVEAAFEFVKRKCKED